MKHQTVKYILSPSIVGATNCQILWATNYSHLNFKDWTLWAKSVCIQCAVHYAVENEHLRMSPLLKRKLTKKFLKKVFDSYDLNQLKVEKWIKVKVEKRKKKLPRIWNKSCPEWSFCETELPYVIVNYFNVLDTTNHWQTSNSQFENHRINLLYKTNFQKYLFTK